MKETPSQKNIFTGNIDLDSEVRSVKDNDYLDASNIRNSVSRDGNYQEVSKIRGNELIPYVQPTGASKSLGSFENLSNRLNYSFHWNSDNKMQIRETNIDNLTVTNIAEYDFKWEQDKYVSNINLVDNKLLLWTDRKPRRINIEKSREDKIFKGNSYFVSNQPDFVPPSTAFTIAILDKNNNVLAIAGYATGISLNKQQTADILTFFINNNPDLSALVTADSCKSYIEFTFKQEGYYIIDIQASNGVSSIYVPQNYYFSITDTIVDAGKYPLLCNPELSIKQDNERVGFNNIERTTWQFATQVIYDDFDESTLSPYSDIIFINCEQRGNYIEVDFSDPRLNNPTDLSIISKIRLLARPNNTGKFREIAVIEQSELWNNSGIIGVNSYRFYNDGQYTVIDDATAQLAYSALPIEVVKDKYDMGQENFDNRIGYSKFIENYEAPCVEASLTASFIENKDTTFDIIGNILIYNPQQFLVADDIGAPGYIGAIHTPISGDYPVFGGASSMDVIEDVGTVGQQYLPEAGFPVYLAGTDYLAISRQQGNVPNVSYNPNGSIDTSTQQGKNDLEAFYEQYDATGGAIGQPFSVFRLQNVKPGKYVLNVASHMCSFDDKLGKGSYYDLNGKLYQRTSTFFRSAQAWDGSTFLTETICKEITINIEENGNYQIFINSALVASGTANNEIFLGRIIIEDISSRIVKTEAVVPEVNFRTVASISGYLTDAGGSSDINVVAQGVAMERQLVTVTTSTTTQLFDKITKLPINPPDTSIVAISVQTDRNGFFYTSGQKMFRNRVPLIFLEVKYTYRISASSVTAGTGFPLLVRNAFDDYYFSPTNNVLQELINLNATLGIFTFEYIDDEVPVPAFGTIPYNTNPLVTQNCSTFIRGKVVDSNGEPLQGITVQYEYTNRIEKTQADGTFSILVYGDYFRPNQNSRANQIILSSCCDCIVEFYGLPQFSLSVLINPFGATGFNRLNAISPNFLNDVIGNIIGDFIRKLKAGGRYIFGAFYVDELNRRCALQTNNLNLSIPFLTEQRQDYFDNVGTGQSNGVFNFALNVTSPPPSWAKKLYVCRTQDTYYLDFLQFPLFDAKYVIQYDNTNSIPIETTYNTFSANEIYLGFPQATISYKEFNSASLKGWDFQEGDRVRFISKPDGSLYDKLYDLPIKAQRTDSTTEYIYFAIDNLDALGEVTSGTLVEVYRPRKDREDEVELYFEIHTCIDIVEVNGQKQHVGLPTQLETGDTYTRNRTVPIQQGVSINFIEDNSISDNWASRQQDIGRIVVKDTRFGRLIRESAVRFSNQYIPGSKINGLSRFEPLNEQEYPRQYGAINKLIMVNDDADIFVLLAVCENNSFVVYVKQVIYNDVRGTDTVAVADRVLGSFRTLKGDYGTKNPESFAKRDGQVFWWDINRGCWVRYDNNGMDDISALGIQQYALDIRIDTNVISAYDDFYSEFITIPLQENYDAIGYLSDKRGWISKYSYKPEMIGTSGEFIISWKDGNAWLHDSPNVPHCNFYGTQYTSKIKFVSKLSPLAIKVAQNIRVKASRVWEALSISTVPNAMYKQGMLSRLKKGNWKNFEGDFWATILRNSNDPRFTNPNEALLKGEPMRGDAFIVELQNDDTDFQTLRSAEMYYFTSENTNG